MTNSVMKFWALSVIMLSVIFFNVMPTTIMLSVIFFHVILTVVMLSAIFFNCYAEFYYAECHYAKCRNAECHGANHRTETTSLNNFFYWLGAKTGSCIAIFIQQQFKQWTK
jgi:hypothetical protein